MKMTKQNQFFSSLQRLLRHAALASLGVLTLAPSADAQRPGILSEEDWVGTLPSIHVGPEELLRSGVEQGISAFYVEGPWRQVLDAAMNAVNGAKENEYVHLWASLPCTAGSPWQNLNRKHPGAAERMEEQIGRAHV